MVEDKRPKKPPGRGRRGCRGRGREDEAEEDVIEDASDLEDDADAIPDEIEVESDADERER